MIADFLEALRGKKTVIVNGLLVLLPVLGYLFPASVLPTPEDAANAVDLGINGLVAVIGLVNLLLRAVTTTSIFRRY